MGFTEKNIFVFRALRSPACPSHLWPKQACQQTLLHQSQGFHGKYYKEDFSKFNNENENSDMDFVFFKHRLGMLHWMIWRTKMGWSITHGATLSYLTSFTTAWTGSVTSRRATKRTAALWLWSYSFRLIQISISTASTRPFVSVISRGGGLLRSLWSLLGFSRST